MSDAMGLMQQFYFTTPYALSVITDDYNELVECDRVYRKNKHYITP